MSPRGRPIASQASAELPRADSVRLRASVDDSPSEPPVVATKPPTPSNNNSNGQRRPSNDTGQTKSQMTRPAPVDHQTHDAKDKLGKVPSPSISTAISERQGSPLST
jgi:hypothetical protein